MVSTYQGRTANEVWQSAYKQISQGDVKSQASRAGMTRELLHCVISIEDPRQRWVPSRVPPINVSFAIAEVIWIMRARRDAAFLAHQSKSFPQFVGMSEELSGAYGFRLREHFGIDQLKRAASALAHSSESRQVVLQIWDAASDLPDDKGHPSSPDVPCNLMSILKVRDGKLEWTQIMRSNDLFRGLPYNIVQFTLLQEVISGWIGVELGSYNQWSDSLHLYEYDNDIHSSDTLVQVENNERLDFPRQESEASFAECERVLNSLMSSNLTPETLVRLVESAQLPIPFRSLAAVCAAEEARRLRWSETVLECMSLCSNEALSQQFFLWYDWIATRKPRRSTTTLG